MINKVKEILANAIRSHSLVLVLYHQQWRVVEPYLIGILGGHEHLHCFQIAGGSVSGGIPQWRNLRLDDIKQLEIIPSSYFEIRDSYHPKNANYMPIEEQIT
ncbi:hypothetical protein [Legionella jordanis]|uniref:WYL domain-containing protein n=1 Tax=Legionella jordanis TaxID=456 RepID=A0A0W0VEA3_9GAMM|nr:hypothetical protein [Legionella jordanis]KTD18418.1 hypothetical protein Ljor_2724 [Legionella jordanis]RMX05324.1 hypothetical protein EAW55_01285 [Legionella jordanis]RMX20825.1 hypothetical protein EAS68_05760 [Legionella jordanis]VEH13233.1 Uncharacterised protein [Legionella jordanis]HAT8713587.1 hypothetical protein [Legionella jordanis]